MSRPPEVPPEVGTGAGPPAPTTPASTTAAPTTPAPATPATPEVVAEPAPGVVDLVTRGARVGIDAAGLLTAEIADASVRVLRAVLPPAIAQRPLDAVGDEVDRRRSSARRRGELNREQAAAALQAVLGQVVTTVLDQIDIAALIDRIPINDVIDEVDIDGILAKVDIGAIVDQVDVDAIVQKVDLDGIVAGIDIGSIVRDSTTGLAGETVDAIRVQVMGLDLFAARVVDKLLRRKGPRDLVLEGYDVYGQEIRVPRELR